jgi:hypothetical protein
MPKSKVYGSPIGTQEPSGAVGRPKAKDADAERVRAALRQVATQPRVTAKPVRGSSTSAPRKLRPPPILDAEIEKQSR